MAGFIEKWAITQARMMQPKRMSATLYSRTFNDIYNAGTFYANIYAQPNKDSSGIANNGTPGIAGDLILYQEGEAFYPFPDDKIIDALGNSWIISDVVSSLQFNANWGIHRCTATQLN